MPVVLWILTQPRWRARVMIEFRVEIMSGGVPLEEAYIRWV